MDPIAQLEARMAAAVEAEDYETAALLRDALARLKSGDSAIHVQQPGKMGLGSSQERYASEGARVLPKKPDPMTKGHKPAGGSRR